MVKRLAAERNTQHKRVRAFLPVSSVTCTSWNTCFNHPVSIIWWKIC